MSNTDEKMKQIEAIAKGGTAGLVILVIALCLAMIWPAVIVPSALMIGPMSLAWAVSNSD